MIDNLTENIEFIYNLSESTVCLIGDPDLITLWEDAHQRRVNMAKAYNFDHYNKDEKVKRGILFPKEKIDTSNGKIKGLRKRQKKANKNFKNQTEYLGVFDNSYDANKEANKAATLRQNLNSLKQSRRLFKNDKVQSEKERKKSLEELKKKNPKEYEKEYNKEIHKYDPKWQRENSKFHSTQYGGANMHKNSYYITDHAVKAGEDEANGAMAHEENHLKDFKDMKKIYGKKMANKFADAGVLANSKHRQALKNKADIYEKTEKDPYSTKNYNERNKADAKVSISKHRYLANPSEYNSKALETAMRKGVLTTENPNKIRAFRLKTLNRFAKNKANTFFNWDKHYS